MEGGEGRNGPVTGPGFYAWFLEQIHHFRGKALVATAGAGLVMNVAVGSGLVDTSGMGRVLALYMVQLAVILACAATIAFGRRPAAYGDVYPRGARAVAQFWGWWPALWLTWVLLYAGLTWDTLAKLLPAPDANVSTLTEFTKEVFDPNRSRREGTPSVAWAITLHVLNNLATLMFIMLYHILAEPTLSAEMRSEGTLFSGPGTVEDGARGEEKAEAPILNDNPSLPRFLFWVGLFALATLGEVGMVLANGDGGDGGSRAEGRVAVVSGSSLQDMYRKGFPRGARESEGEFRRRFDAWLLSQTGSGKPEAGGSDSAMRPLLVEFRVSRDGDEQARRGTDEPEDEWLARVRAMERERGEARERAAFAKEQVRRTGYFGMLFGVLASVATALVVGKLDSRLLGIPPMVILLFFFYAAIQPSFDMIIGEEHGPLAETVRLVLITFALISKLALFCIVQWLAMTNRLLYFMVEYHTLAEGVDGHRRRFLHRLDGGRNATEGDPAVACGETGSAPPEGGGR